MDEKFAEVYNKPEHLWTGNKQSGNYIKKQAYLKKMQSPGWQSKHSGRFIYHLQRV